MKTLFFAVIAFVLSLSATANNLKEGKSADFNSMKKEGVQLTPEQFIEKIKTGDMSWSRDGITYEEYLQTIADWCNETNVWQVAGFNKPLNVANVKYMIVNSTPMLVTVPAKALKVMGSSPNGSVGYFFNEFEMDVKFLTFKSNNGYLIPLVKYTCFNGVGGFTVSPDVITITKVNEITKINYRDSVVQVIERVRIEDHVTVVDRVTQYDRVQTGCYDCYQPVYCQGYDRPAATGFGFNLGLSFTFVKNNQPPASAAAQPIYITINNSNTQTQTQTSTNTNNNTNNNTHETVVLQPEVITPQSPQGQPVDGNPVVLNPDGTPIDGTPIVTNPDGTPIDGNPLKSNSGNSARTASVSPVQSGSGKFGQKDQTTAKVNTEQPVTAVAPLQKSGKFGQVSENTAKTIPAEQPVTASAPVQKSGKFGQVTSQSNSDSKISSTPVQQTTATVKSGKFGQSNSQSASDAPTNNQSARNTQPTYTNGSGKYKNQDNYVSPKQVNKPANVNYRNNGSKFSNSKPMNNNSGSRMITNSVSNPGSGKFNK